MRVKLISANVLTGFIPEVTKPDKRYKKGYRVISEKRNTYQIKLKTTNPKGELRLHQNVQAPWGLFRVVGKNFTMPDGELEMIQCRAIEYGNNLEFNAEFDILPLGFTVGEGSRP